MADNKEDNKAGKMKYAVRIRTREELKGMFLNGAIPTQDDYHDLIDSMRHISEKGEKDTATTADVIAGQKSGQSVDPVSVDAAIKAQIATLPTKENVENVKKVAVFAKETAVFAKETAVGAQGKIAALNTKLIDTTNTINQNIVKERTETTKQIAAREAILNQSIGAKEPVFAKNTAFNRSFGDRANSVAEGNKAFLARRKLSHGDSIDNIKEMGVYDASSSGYLPNNIVGATARELMVYKFDDRIVVQMLITDEGTFVRRHAGLWESWVGLADREKVMGDRGVIKGSGNLNPYRTHNGVYHIEPSDTYLMPVNWPWLRVNKEFGTKLMVIKEKNSDEAKQIVFADEKIATRKYYNRGGSWLWSVWTRFEPLSNLVLPPQPLGQLVAIGKMNQEGELEMGGGINAHKCKMTDMIYYIEFSKPLDTLIYQVNIELGEDNIKDLNRVNIPIVTEKTYTGFKVYFSDSFYNHKDMRTSKNRTLQSHAFDFTVMMWNRKGLIDTSNYYNPPVKI